MATYNVTKDGIAPKDAKAGDYIVTGGGTYEVLDPTKFKGMDSAALKSAGVSYNPLSGLYSTKVNSVTPSEVNLMNYGTAQNWLSEADSAAKAALDSAYQKNVSSLTQKYNSNKSDLNTQIGDTKAAYLENMLANQEDAYMDAKNALYGAEARGMTNSAQGQAMTNSMLWDASKEQGSLRRERDQMINNIKTQINTLTQNYNLGLTELEKSKLADELASMSDNKLKYLSSLMDIDKANQDAMNMATQAKLDKEFQMKLAAMSGSGGGGGYRGGSTYDNGSSNRDLDAAVEYAVAMYPNAEDSIRDKYSRVRAGYMDSNEFTKFLDGLVSTHDTTSHMERIFGTLFKNDKNNKNNNSNISYYNTR